MSPDTQASTAPVLRNAHALIIQITQYPEQPLPQVHDAADIAAALQDPSLCGYPADQVTLLLDSQATHEAILRELRRLAAVADEEATVLFYFSGHGGLYEQTTYLMPVDSDLRSKRSAALSAQDLARELAALRARKTLLVFDCCRAGAFEAKEEGSAAKLQPGLDPAARELLLQGSGWVLFSASDVDEFAFVQAGERNSLFTKHFLAGLRGEQPSEDGLVKVFQLFEYLQPRVTLEMPSQHPIFKCKINENFPVALSRGGKIGALPRTKDGFLHDALLLYAKADAPFVRTTLLPRMRAANLRVATTNALLEPGLDRVIAIDRGLEQSRRVLVVVSKDFLNRNTKDDKYADYSTLQHKHADIGSGRFSIVPIYVEDRDSLSDQPPWLASLEGIKLGNALGPYDDAEEEMERLLKALASPVPRR